MSNCPICNLDGVRNVPVGNSLRFEFNCRRCGRFSLTDELQDHLRSDNLTPLEQTLLRYLPAFIRKQNEIGETPQLDTLNWQEFANRHRGVSVSEKTRRLLEVLASKSEYPGQETGFNFTQDYPLLSCSKAEEAVFYFLHLNDGGLIKGEIGKDIAHATITVEGWRSLEAGVSSGVPGRCFIAMSFHPDLDPAYRDGIDLAIRDDCGMDPVRVDKEEHNEKICDRIIAKIRLAQFLVADFTQHKAGVYFEAGFAMGLGRPVIWLCREDDLEKAHFDTRQYNHIVWSNPADLRRKLKNRVQATIVKS